MKRVNGMVFTDNEWKRNQWGIVFAAVFFEIGLLLLWWFLG